MSEPCHEYISSRLPFDIYKMCILEFPISRIVIYGSVCLVMGASEQDQFGQISDALCSHSDETSPGRRKQEECPPVVDCKLTNSLNSSITHYFIFLMISFHYRATSCFPSRGL